MPQSRWLSPRDLVIHQTLPFADAPETRILEDAGPLSISGGDADQATLELQTASLSAASNTAPRSPSSGHELNDRHDKRGDGRHFCQHRQAQELTLLRIQPARSVQDLYLVLSCLMACLGLVLRLPVLQPASQIVGRKLCE